MPEIGPNPLCGFESRPDATLYLHHQNGKHDYIWCGKNSGQQLKQKAYRD